MATATLDAVISHLKSETRVGAYRAAQDARPDMDSFYERAAAAIGGTDASEIAFMDSASRAWNMALYGSGLQEGDTIVTLSSEFGTNLVSLFHYASLVGASVEVINCGSDGSFSMDSLVSAVGQGAKLIALSHATAHASIVNPVEQIGVVAREHNVSYIVDGCQAIGQLPVNVGAIGCDAYTASGRKWLRGPRGTAFLYMRSNAAFNAPQVDLASADLVLDKDGRPQHAVDVRKDARQFELWERSVASMLGLSAALAEYLALDTHDAGAQISRKANELRLAVDNNSSLRLMGKTDSPSGIVGFYLANVKDEKRMTRAFEEAEFGISMMSDWDCPLHFPRTGASKIFRVSPHFYTPDATVQHASAMLAAF